MRTCIDEIDWSTCFVDKTGQLILLDHDEAISLRKAFNRKSQKPNSYIVQNT